MMFLASCFIYGLLHDVHCPKDETLINGTCYPTTCVNDEGQVCGNHGTCIQGSYYGEYYCQCDPQTFAFGSDCIPESCLYFLDKCNGIGTCVDDQTGNSHCECPYYASGQFCEVCLEGGMSLFGTCFDPVCLTHYPNGNILECGGFGTCEPISLEEHTWDCNCEKDTIKVDMLCIPDTCISNPDTLEVCSGHGYCLYACRCDEGYEGDVCQTKILTCDEDQMYINGECVAKSCITSGTSVCSGHGSCKDGSCVCDDHYARIGTSECLPFECIVHGDVCPGGTCVTSRGPAHCVCNLDYVEFDGVCYPEACITTRHEYNPPELCNDRGTCDYETGVCACDWMYSGKTCQACSNRTMEINGECVVDTCLSTEADGSVSVCRNHGKCVLTSLDMDPIHICFCEADYTLIDTSVCIHDNCLTSSDGFGTECNNNGVCDNEKGICICNAGYKGGLCEDFECPEGQTYVYGEGCTPNSCVDMYIDNERRVCGGLGDCFAEACICRGTAIPYNGTCISSDCLTSTNKDVLCHGIGQCRDGRCFYR